MQIHFHSLLWSYLTKVPIFLAMTENIYRQTHPAFRYLHQKQESRVQMWEVKGQQKKKKKNTEGSQEHLELRELFEVKQSLLVRVS